MIAGTLESVIKRITLQLTDMGCQFDSAMRGHEIVLKALAPPADMFLVDVTLDDLHAYELVRIIRYFPQFKKIPILVFSSPISGSDLVTSHGFQYALSLDSAKMQCLEAGATECVGEFSELSFKGIIARYFQTSSVRPV